MFTICIIISVVYVPAIIWIAPRLAIRMLLGNPV